MTDRSEPAFLLTEDDAAKKSAIAREFIESRRDLNAVVERADNYFAGIAPSK